MERIVYLLITAFVAVSLAGIPDAPTQSLPGRPNGQLIHNPTPKSRPSFIRPVTERPGTTGKYGVPSFKPSDNGTPRNAFGKPGTRPFVPEEKNDTSTGKYPDSRPFIPPLLNRPANPSSRPSFPGNPRGTGGPSVSETLPLGACQRRGTSGVLQKNHQVPKIPRSYQTFLEVKLSDYSKTLEEFYNDELKVGLVRTTAPYRRYDNLYKYDADTMFQISYSAHTRCYLRKISDLRKIGMSSAMNYETKRLFDEALQFAVWSGNETVRGIPCNCWVRCRNDSDSMFVYKSCFKTDKYNVFIKGNDIPIRIDVTKYSTSTGKTVLRQLYDFVSFIPGPPKEKSIFQMKKGVYCKTNGTLFHKPFPALPNMFTMSTETALRINEEEKGVVGMPQVTYSSKTKLIKIMRTFGKDVVKKVDGTQKLCAGPMFESLHENGENAGNAFVYDFISGVTYEMDTYKGTCNITKNENDWEKLDLMKPISLLADGKYKYFYQGQKTFRGFTVDAWAAIDSSFNEREFYFTQEKGKKQKLIGMTVSFTKITMSSDGTCLDQKIRSQQKATPPSVKPRGTPRPLSTSNGRSGISGALVPGQKLSGNGVDIENTNFGSSNSKNTVKLQNVMLFTNVFNFDTTLDEMSYFDVSQCYEPGHRYKDVNLVLMPVNYKSLLKTGKHMELVSTIHDHLYHTVKVHPTRMSAVKLHDGNKPNRISVQFKLFDKPKLSDGTEIDDKLSPSLEELYDTVVRITRSGLPVPLKLDHAQCKLFAADPEEGALRSDKMKTTDFEKSDTNDVGLSLGLFVIGAVTGVGIFIFGYKLYVKVKRKGNPYLVTA